jgi:hypothetical protein
MTRRTLTLLFVSEIVAFAFLAFALADRRVHQRDPVFGLNQWGYRGEARAEREAGEIRVALVGGSSVYEAGVGHEDTLASRLFFELRDAGAPRGQAYSVVNLSEPRVGADSYVQALDDYDFLQSDVICVLDGYDALEGLPPHARRRSLVFRSTGYLPILPARLLQRPAWLSDPPDGIADILQDGRMEDISCDGASRAYCAAMAETVRVGLRRGRVVVVGSPPIVSFRHGVQQRSLGEALQREFSGDRRFVFVDLAPWVNMSDRANSPDGVRRTLEGNHVIAQQLGIAIVKRLAAFTVGSN